MNFLTSIAKYTLVPLGRQIAKYTLVPLGRQIGYLIFYNNNINNLENVLGDLNREKTRIDQRVDAAKRDLRVPVHEITTWQQKVDVIIGQAIKFLDEEIKSNRKCLNDLCPNPKSRYSLSRNATKMKQEILLLLNQAEKFGQIDYEPATQHALSSIFNTEGTQEFESRNLIMKEILEALKDDHSNMISICGLPGVGKTTMVEKLVQIVESQKLFHDVAMAVVTQNPDVKALQGDIASCLDLKFHDENEQERVKKLHERIIYANSEKKILVILDDVWTEMDFQKLRIPSVGKRVGYKILLTSRREDECRKMGCLNFRIDALSNEEGWNLFKWIAFAGNSIDIHDDSHQLAKQIADECDGLPLVIVTLAKALKGRAVPIWADTLNQLRSSNLSGISGMGIVRSRLELSYNLLQLEEAKKCFLLCCLFPEDYAIPIEDLVRYVVGLRLLDNAETILQARNRVYALIEELKESFLLLDGNKYEEGYVKMHDVVRDVAISIAAREKSYLVSCEYTMNRWPKAWANRYNDCAAISLWCEEIKEHPTNLEFPQLQLLQLHQSTGSLPDNFFEGMKELKVVALKGISLPESLAVIKKVRTLHLSNMESASRIGYLENVEILKIGISNNLQELPIGVGLMENLRLLDMRDLFNLAHIPAGVLSKFSKLEELYVNQYFMHWGLPKGRVRSRMNASLTESESSLSTTLEDGVEMNASLGELLEDGVEMNASLGELDYLPVSTLEIGVSTISQLPKRSSLEKLVNFKISINIEESTTSQKSGNALSLAGRAREIIPSGICVLLKRTEHLEIMVKKLKNDLYDLGDDGFPELKTLEMSQCDDVKELVDVKKIKDGCFKKLREIRVSVCRRLTYLFPMNMTTRISQCLQSISILRCENMKVIFNGREEGGCIEFPNLKEIYLSGLPYLKALWIHTSNDHQEVKSNSIERPSYILFPSSWIVTSNLKELTLISCRLLKIIFATSVAEQLLHLRTLQIHCCEQVEYIVGGQGGNTNKTIIFPKLTKVSFVQLPKLECFSVQDLDWRSLKDIDVRHCPKIQSIIGAIQGPSTSDQTQILFKIPSEFKELLKDAEEGNGNTEITEFSELKRIKLENMVNMRCFHSGINAVEFPSLEYLQINLCSSMKTFSYGSSLSTPRLRSIRVDGTDIYPIIDLNRTVREEILPNLHLYSVENLARISLHHLSNEEMGEIRQIRINYCRNLSNVIPCDLIARLQKVEILDVKECDLVEEIFEYDGVKNEKGNVAISSHLQQIMLENLRNLKHVFNKIPTTVVVFPKLKLLSIYSCKSLKNIFSVLMVRCLLQLEELRISRCDGLEEIVAKEDEEEKAVTDNIVLPQLWSVDVAYASELNFFYCGSCALELPSLRSLKLNGHRMKSFSNGLVSSPQLTHVQINQKDYSHSGDLNDDIKNERFEKVNIECTEAFMKLRLTAEDSSRIKYLSISDCETPLKVIPNNLVGSVQKLEKLIVDSCDSVEEIFEYNGASSIEKTSVAVISNLEEICLIHLPKLRHIFNKIPRCILSFQKLRKLDVFRCDNLKNIFSVSLARDLVLLEELKITKCYGVEQIMAKEEGEEEEITNKIVFPQLRRIDISSIGEGSFRLKCFYSGMYALEFPLLEGLSFDKCYSMTTFSTGSLTTPKLQRVQINENNYLCTGNLNQDLKNKILEKVEVNKDEHFTRICQIAEGSSVIQDLSISHMTFHKLFDATIPCSVIQDLEKLHVQWCHSMEVIFELDEQTTFSSLQNIKLYDLYNLRHIFNKITNGFAGFQQLTTLEVRSCLSLENVFTFSMVRGLRQLQELQITSCYMEQIIAKEDESVTEKIVLPQLKSIKVIHSHKLKCFYNGVCDIELPLLESLTIEECPAMEMFSNGSVRTPKLQNLQRDYEDYPSCGDLNADFRKKKWRLI